MKIVNKEVKFMNTLNDWFDKGLTRETYIETMTTNKESLLAVYNQFNLTSKDKEWLATIKSKQLRAVILTADWCNDAMVNLPIFMKLAEEADIETRYLIRDENLELMDQYLTNGTARSIPIILFINDAGEEVTKWGPRAPEVQRFADELRSSLPAKDDSGYEAAMNAFIQSMKTRFTTDKELWQHIKTDLIQTLQQTL